MVLFCISVIFIVSEIILKDSYYVQNYQWEAVFAINFSLRIPN